MRYFFHIAYHGHQLSGWQKHPSGISVQQIIENALAKIFKKTISIVGCGRTDAGVHASQFFFHADFEHQWDFDLLFRINKALPANISVYDIVPVGDKQHARFDAKERSYRYFVHTYKNPYLSNFSALYLNYEFDFKRMQLACELLLTYQDFGAFCTTPNKNKHTLCVIQSAKLIPHATGFEFQITANRFLSKMIRIIVARLIAVGTGKLNLLAFERYLQQPNLPLDIIPAHPQGLYLAKVSYPFLNLSPRNSFLKGLADTQ